MVHVCLLSLGMNMDLLLGGLQLAGKYRNTGQTCVCINRVLVQDGKYKKDHTASSLVICFREIVEVRAFAYLQLKESVYPQEPLIFVL